MTEKKKTPTTVEELTQQLKWRLAKQPTLDDVTTMLEKGIIDKDEARQILFSSEKTQEVGALKEQIEFLEKCVEKLIEKREATTINNYGWTMPTVTYTPHYPTKYWITGNVSTGGAIYSVSSNLVSLNTGTVSGSSGTGIALGTGNSIK